MTRDMLEPEAWQALATRTLGPAMAESLGAPKSAEPLCRVRLFGAYEVTLPDGVLGDKGWPKRRARLLFAMLVVKQGREIPRDQLLEHLWPDVEEARARNNFYVLWNAMKRGLMRGKTGSCPYIDNACGVCRVDARLVRSDLDDMEEALSDARRAEAAGDMDAALAALLTVAELYGGDLLPSELYDDWFASTRERCRQEYGDAMLRAAQIQEATGDLGGALQTVRNALAHDPWREDLYQAVMRYQLTAGQRSAAVETYQSLKGRLAEDLGLDPSFETRRLYDQILAMEEEPAE
jgi:DNA-binding SARP family transcriptional activator